MAEKAKGKMEQLKGKGKEAVGKVAGDDRMKAEGKTDQAKGKAREAMGKAQDSARGVDDSLRGKKR
ncbi:CsbD family protein [Streptomyces sp. NPDC004311]|uniref:CsbD family protein n=1 Tax=unclassified Streptomyces TaxID=2593676 RepID=UPI0033C33D41